MFSWSKKKDDKKRRGDRNSEENEFGIKLDKGPSDKQLEAELKALAGVDELPDDVQLNEGEDDVESELLRLIGGKAKKQTTKKQTNNDETSPSDIMADITAEIDFGDEDVDIDENDPDLLGELMELTQPENGNCDIDDNDESEPESDEEENSNSVEGDIMAVLKERLKMYKTAEAKAKENNESSRARRFSRGIKTLDDLMKRAKAGKAVSQSEIPPTIALNLKPAPPAQPDVFQNEGNLNGIEKEVGGDAEENSVCETNMKNENSDMSDKSQDIMSILSERLQMYQIAENKANENGETTRARRFNRGIKTIEGLIKQAQVGKMISSSDIPPKVALNLMKEVPVQQPQSQDDSVTVDSEDVEDEMGTINLESEGDDSSYSKESQEKERNILDILSGRLKMYQTAEAKAKEAGEATRARRFTRGIKTLQDLLRKATAGKPILPDDIPPPIALNLAPAPAYIAEEEEPRDLFIERDTLVQSSDRNEISPIKFAPTEDEEIDLDEELFEEEIPTTVLQGLEQRLKIYKKLFQKAQNAGDEVSAKENENYVRIYLNAIRTYKNGGYVDVLKLPTPKGCPPIPIPFHIP